MSVKLLTEHYLEFQSLKRGCTGSSESTLVKMPHCWKSHVTAHLSPHPTPGGWGYCPFEDGGSVAVYSLFIVAPIFVGPCFVQYLIFFLVTGKQPQNNVVSTTSHRRCYDVYFDVICLLGWLFLAMPLVGLQCVIDHNVTHFCLGARAPKHNI